jgi:hypothetical protein
MGGGENGFEGWEERLLGLLDTSLEEIGRLEENGGCETGAETGGEVEYCFGCCRAELARVAVLCRCQAHYMWRCPRSRALLMRRCSTWRPPQGQPGTVAIQGARIVMGGSITRSNSHVSRGWRRGWRRNGRFFAVHRMQAPN